MERRQIEVTCPCCESRLAIDVRTETVLRSRPKGAEGETAGDERWDAAVERVSGREDTAHDAFERALEDERTRSKDLEKRFERGRRRLEE